MVRRFHDNISSVGLDLVKGMYRQLDFIHKVCSNFSYWYDVEVIGQAIHRYNLFMHLNCDHDKTLYPTTDIAIVWHAHQINLCNTYLKDTQKLCGRMIDHDDLLDGEDPHKAYARTFIWWNEKYSSPYSANRPDFWHWQQNHNVKSALFPPYGVFRLLKWSVLSAGKTDGHSSFNPETGQKNAVIGTPVFDEEVRPLNQLESPLYTSLKVLSAMQVPRVTLDLSVDTADVWEVPVTTHEENTHHPPQQVDEEEEMEVVLAEAVDSSAPPIEAISVFAQKEEVARNKEGEGKEAESEEVQKSSNQFENA
eukprot:gene30299-37491_t